MVTHFIPIPHKQGTTISQHSRTASKKDTDHGGFTNLHQKFDLVEGKSSHRGDEATGNSPSCCNLLKRRVSPKTSSRDIENFSFDSSPTLPLYCESTPPISSSRREDEDRGLGYRSPWPVDEKCNEAREGVLSREKKEKKREKKENWASRPFRFDSNRFGLIQ
ncbi:hypothetical protein JCGZ_16394 [Jatropha curcas]|uniref:Uncharacterized protein n=1 Tax=Jatropha curcas TaxID=180498 RepID=A0A067K3J0_JATCU|nr:hypothetical protein JCGZ_16394 [Jatropha curcas]